MCKFIFTLEETYIFVVFIYRIQLLFGYRLCMIEKHMTAILLTKTID